MGFALRLGDSMQRPSRMTPRTVPEVVDLRPVKQAARAYPAGHILRETLALEEDSLPRELALAKLQTYAYLMAAMTDQDGRGLTGVGNRQWVNASQSTRGTR